MASIYQFPLSFLPASHLQSHNPILLPNSHKNPRKLAAINGDNGVTKTLKPKSKARKKGTEGKTKRSRKPESEPDSGTDLTIEEIEEDYDDGIDFPYEQPPLICCFGAAQKEFVPSVRKSEIQMHPDMYSTWKNLQWDPPEFVRAPGGPPSNVAIAHVRLGGRAAFIGKVGDDDFGQELVLTMNKEKVQTRGVKFDTEGARTGAAYMRIKFEDGKMKAETVRESAEDSLLATELNISVLKEARIFHFNSEVITSPKMEPALYRAIAWSRKFGGLVFFDLKLIF